MCAEAGTHREKNEVKTLEREKTAHGPGELPLYNKGHARLPEARREAGNRAFPGTLRGSRALPTPWPDFRPPRTVRQCIPVVLNCTQHVTLCYSGLGNEYSTCFKSLLKSFMDARVNDCVCVSQPLAVSML